MKTITPTEKLRRERISAFQKGRPKSEQMKQRLSASKKGIICPWSVEHCRQLGKSQKGEKHPNWKGNLVGYRALHDWVERTLGIPIKCKKCKKPYIKKVRRNIQWANISGKYKRDKKDWIALCIGCHKKKDYPNGYICGRPKIIIINPKNEQ